MELFTIMLGEEELIPSRLTYIYQEERVRLFKGYSEGISIYLLYLTGFTTSRKPGGNRWCKVFIQ
jgi:hypothetical protein